MSVSAAAAQHSAHTQRCQPCGEQVVRRRRGDLQTSAAFSPSSERPTSERALYRGQPDGAPQRPALLA
jgi:hypothetical protein